MNIGEKIRKVRLEQDLTQQELADKVGISRSNIANYEMNANMPSVDILKKIASVLEISADYLLEDDLTNDEETDEVKDNTEEPVTEYLIESDILDQELARKMVQVLVNEGKAIPAKRAYKIIDIAKSMVENLAYIYYKV